MRPRWPRESSLFWTGAFMLWGTIPFAFGSLGFLGRAAIKLEGAITFSETTCEGPTGHRCSTLYLITSEVTGDTVRYRAYANDQALAGRLPVGTHLRKERWSLSYDVNRVRIDDFPKWFYLLVMVCGLALLLTALWRFVRLRQWEDLGRLGEDESP